MGDCGWNSRGLLTWQKGPKNPSYKWLWRSEGAWKPTLVARRHWRHQQLYRLIRVGCRRGGKFARRKREKFLYCEGGKNIYPKLNTQKGYNEHQSVLCSPPLGKKWTLQRNTRCAGEGEQIYVMSLQFGFFLMHFVSKCDAFLLQNRIKETLKPKKIPQPAAAAVYSQADIGGTSTDPILI